AVVDEDKSAESAAFITALEKSGQVQLFMAPLHAAKQRVVKGKASLYLRFPKGFGASQRLAILGHPPLIEMGVDPSRKASAGMTRGLILQTAGAMLAQSLKDPAAAGKALQKALDDPATLPGLTPEAREKLVKNAAMFGQMLQFVPKDFPLFNMEPLRIKPAPISTDSGRLENTFNVSFPQGILWGILSCLITFAVSLIQEKTRGTLVRLHTSPISRIHIIGGKAVASFLTNLFIVFALITLAALAFKVRPTSIGLFIFSAVSISLGFTGIMIFVSVLARTERAAESMAWAVMMILAMTGGAMIPLFIMPDWMLTISSISPVKWGIVSLEGVLWRGFSFTELLVPNGIVMGFGLVFFLLGLAVYRRRSEI
ncbi:ABC transporter permease, partial [Myxococcota bacterium]|nr:ABC transporter permease [Myxococcota bacterium]